VSNPSKQHAERKDVRAAVRLRKAVLFGRGERLRAETNRIRLCVFVVNARNAKIDQRGLPLVADDDVLRLDVAMDNRRRLFVQIAEHVAQLNGDGDRLFLRQVLFQTVERNPSHVLAHHAKHADALEFFHERRQPAMMQLFEQHVFGRFRRREHRYNTLRYREDWYDP
jgi:hypothetical protein